MKLYSIFFEGKLKGEENKFIYNEDFVEYIIANYIYKMQNETTEKEIYDYLSTIYNVNIIKKNSLKGYLEKNFESINENYFSLSEKQNRSLQHLFIFKKNFVNYFSLSEDGLYYNIADYIGCNDFYIDKALGYILILQYKNNNLNDKSFIYYIYYTIIRNLPNLYRKIDKKMIDIDDFYNNLKIVNIISNRTELNILFSKNINTIYDLKQLSIMSLIVLFSVNILDFINIIDALGVDFMFKDKIISLYNKLSDNELFVLNKRFIYDKSWKQLTLEETALLMGITRERVRQIESKALRKILLEKNEIKNIIFCLYEKLIKENEKYFEVERLIDFIDNDSVLKIILLFLEVGNLKLKYERKYRVIYDSEAISLEDIIKETVENMGDIISKKNIILLNSFQREVLNSEYHQYQNGIYLKKGLPIRYLYSSIIKELFQDGYHVNNNNSYNLVIKEIKRRYGDIDNVPSQHALQAMIERSDFSLIDRGIYLSNDLCIQIPDELLDQIIEYIFINKPVVFYRTIFEKFKDDLKGYGIDNHYYLKGCIDKCLPNNLNTKKDYIIVGNINISSSESIISLMHSFAGEFNIDDLRKKFNGVKDYTFYLLLYREVENGLIWTSFNSFIYVDKMELDESIKKELKIFIENLFFQLDTTVLSSRKIYAKLSISNKNLFEKLNLLHGHFTLFSIIKFFYDEYFYKESPCVLRGFVTLCIGHSTTA
jgi:hypothetical protein